MDTYTESAEPNEPNYWQGQQLEQEIEEEVLKIIDFVYAECGVNDAKILAYATGARWIAPKINLDKLKAKEE